MKKILIKHSGKYPTIQWKPVKYSSGKININQASKYVKPNLRKLYLKFMNKRFSKHYTSYDYAKEWVNRFNTSKPEYYMDSTSIKIYKKIKK